MGAKGIKEGWVCLNLFDMHIEVVTGKRGRKKKRMKDEKSGGCA